MRHLHGQFWTWSGNDHLALFSFIPLWVHRSVVQDQTRMSSLSRRCPNINFPISTSTVTSSIQQIKPEAAFHCHTFTKPNLVNLINKIHNKDPQKWKKKWKKFDENQKFSKKISKKFRKFFKSDITSELRRVDLPKIDV